MFGELQEIINLLITNYPYLFTNAGKNEIAPEQNLEFL